MSLYVERRDWVPAAVALGVLTVGGAVGLGLAKLMKRKAGRPAKFGAAAKGEAEAEAEAEAEPAQNGRPGLDRPTPKHGTSTTKPPGKPGKPIELKHAWIAYPVDEVAEDEKTLRDIEIFSEEGKEWIRGELTVRYHVPGGPGLPGTWSDPCYLFAWDKTPLPDHVIHVESDTKTLIQSEGCQSARDDLLELRIAPVAGDSYALGLYIDTGWKIWVQGHVDVGATTLIG